MDKLKKILSVIFVILTIVSLGQTDTNQHFDKTTSENVIVKKYDKIISDSTNKLTNKIEELEVEYIVWGCACPNWITVEDIDKSDTTQNYLNLHFYIEPADKSLKLPVYFDAFEHNLKLTGQFYEREDYPQGTIEQEEPMPKARVFRYTKVEVIQK